MNEQLEKVFLQQREKFRSSNIPAEEQLFFHGTDLQLINSILRENFDLQSSARQSRRVERNSLRLIAGHRNCRRL